MDTTEVDGDSVRGRLRSAASLLALVLALGLLTAAILGTIAVVVTGLIDRALG